MFILAACTAMPLCINEPLGAALFHERLAIVAPALLLFRTVYVTTLPDEVFKRVCCLMLFAMCVCLIRSIIKEKREQ